MAEEPRIPVFDVGDTLLPDDRLMNEAVKEVVKERGYPEQEIPRFPIHRYNIFRLDEVQKFLMANQLEASPEEITERYREKARKFLADSHVMDSLAQCSSGIGKIGFISDNSVGEKEFMEEVLRQHFIDYKGYVVSEEVGAEKPAEEIFRAFLELRNAAGEEFAYFGNHVARDQACEKVGMRFVWVKQFNTFGSRYNGEQIDKISFENVREAVA